MRTTISIPDDLHASLMADARRNNRELSAEITARIQKPAPVANKTFDYIGESQIVELETPLPCSIRTPDRICGKPATKAHAAPVEIRGQWAIEGAWMLQPVCKECAAKAALLYK